MLHTVSRWLGLSALAAAVAATGCVHRPDHEFRTINTDLYEISVQRGGFVDVNTIAGDTIFANAYPSVWIEGEDAPRRLQAEGRHTARRPVEDRLGHGHGLVFATNEMEWHLRAYPAQPFLAVQAAFTNTSNNSVRVRAFSPWNVDAGRGGRLSLGAGTANARILADRGLFDAPEAPPEITQGSALGRWHVSVDNPATGRSLTAAFLTTEQGAPEIELDRTGEAPANAYDMFSASLRFDPPVEVPPGAQLQSGVLYLAVGGRDVHDNLERMANAARVSNAVRPDTPVRFNGWSRWGAPLPPEEVTEARLLAELDVQYEQLMRHGWNHVTVHEGWESAKGDWRSHPDRFPNGVQSIAAEANARGMTAALVLDPFVVDTNSELAREHPQWLAQPSAENRAYLAEDEAILDPTVPGALDHARNAVREAVQTWGFDGIVAPRWVLPILWAEELQNPASTRFAAALQAGDSLREAMGPPAALMAGGILMPAQAQGASVHGSGTLAAQAGDSLAQFDASLLRALRRSHYAPYVWSHALTPLSLDALEGGEIVDGRWRPPEGALARLTAAAMMGGPVTFPQAPSSLGRTELEILRRLAPGHGRPARPVGLFNDGLPHILALPLNDATGRWHLVGVFNWDGDGPANVTLNMTQLGMQFGQYYTVYDFWRQHYHGSAIRQLNVQVPAGGVRLLAFRRRTDHPTFLSMDNHFMQGALDLSAVQWRPGERTLSGTIETAAATPYRVHIFVPEGYSVSTATADGAPVEWTGDGWVTSLAFYAETGGPVDWSVTF